MGVRWVLHLRVPAFQVPLQAHFQALQALVHAVETLVDPVLVADFPILAAALGAAVRAAFGAFAPPPGPSPVPAGPFVVVPAFSSHVGLLSGRIAANLTVPGRHAA